ncbi:hypothetical protein NJNGDCLN_02178 [Mannheimia haemolytica]
MLGKDVSPLFYFGETDYDNSDFYSKKLLQSSHNRNRLSEQYPHSDSEKGDEFLACTIGALIGEAGEGAKAEYRYFDCKVVGEAAIDLVNRAKASVEADKKVLISFVLADLWTDTFTYQKDGKNHKKGDTGVMLKARLIRIKSVKIDGVVKYQEPEKIDAQSE